MSIINPAGPIGRPQPRVEAPQRRQPVDKPQQPKF